MVDALASDRSDQPFGEAVLPRRAWGDGLVADAHGAQSVRDGSAIDAIPMTDQVARRLRPRECCDDLRCDQVRTEGSVVRGKRRSGLKGEINRGSKEGSCATMPRRR